MEAKQILEALKAKVQQRILEKGYDQVEILAEFKLRKGELSRVSEKEVFVKDGIPGKDSFGPKYSEYVFQSEMHDLTEVFWLFREIPRMTWFETSPFYPKCPFKQKQIVEMRINNGSWKEWKV